MKFVVNCDLKEFRKYLERIGLYKGEDLKELENHVVNKFFNLIIWKEDNEIIGHTIWHKSNTEEHRKGVPREEEDTEILERLLGGQKDFVELHEVWLTEAHRGKGYGSEFFEFFEEFIRNKGYDSIIYYADHPAAVAICRQRGYKEEYWKAKGWYVFSLPLERL